MNLELGWDHIIFEISFICIFGSCKANTSGGALYYYYIKAGISPGKQLLIMEEDFLCDIVSICLRSWRNYHTSGCDCCWVIF